VRGSTNYLVVLLCMINMGVQVEFCACKVVWKAMSLSLIKNLHGNRGKRNTQLHRSIIENEFRVGLRRNKYSLNC
jgi:hypothetical protein